MIALPIAKFLTPIFLALSISAVQADQFGSLVRLDGSRLTGSLSFAKDQVTIREGDGKSHTIPITEMRQAIFAEGPGQGSGRDGLARNGLRGRYFSNTRHQGNPLERIDPNINFDWQLEPPANGITPDEFSVRWEGEVEAPISGEIIFEVESDDGCRLWVDGKKLIDHWEAQSATSHSGKVSLEAGRRYPIRLDYYDASSIAVARLRWRAEGLPRNPIPAEKLFPLPLNRTDEKTYLHAVRLKSGSTFAGKITNADQKRVQLETADGKITFPTPAVSLLRLGNSWGADLTAQLADRPPGCALLNRDFVEGKLKKLSDGAAEIESVLFGSKTIRRAELRAIKLADQLPRPARFRLLTTSDTAVLITDITSQPDGLLKIRDCSGYHLTIPAAMIRQIRGASPSTQGK